MNPLELQVLAIVAGVPVEAGAQQPETQALTPLCPTEVLLPAPILPQARRQVRPVPRSFRRAPLSRRAQATTAR